MSSIDERIVQMRFNSGQFQSGVKGVLDSLGQLTKGLQMKGATSGIDNISGAASSASGEVDDLGRSADGASGKFSAMGAVAFGALASIGAKAADVGLSMAKELAVSPITDGFSEYELKLGSIQTIMSGTGASLEDVNAKLLELNDYSDQTIYSFADMTSNIGKFTNAGVDLDTAVASIKGVSNVAAISGASASDAARAMYNLGQALGSGSVKLVDWMSIENANMATSSFKEHLLNQAAAIGELTKVGDKWKTKSGAMIDANIGFRDSLTSDQWLTSDVLTATLGEYADATTEIGKASMAAAQDIKSGTQLWGVFQEAVGSGWAQSFEIIVGNFKQAKAFWTQVNSIIGDGWISDMSNARNDMLQAWADGGGRDSAVNAFLNILKSIDGIIGPIGDAFQSVFSSAEQGGALISLTKGFEKLTEALVPSESAIEGLKRTFAGLFAVVHVITTIIGTIGKIVGAVLSPFLSSVGVLRGGVFGLTGNIGDMLVAFDQWFQKTTFVTDSVETVNKAIQTLTGWLKTAYAYLKPIVQGGWDTAWSFMADGVSDFEAKVSDLVDGPLANLKSVFSGPINSFKSFGDTVVDTYWVVVEFFDGLKQEVQNGSAAGYDFGASAFEHISEAASNAWEFLRKVGTSVGNAISASWDVLVGIGERLRNAFGWVSDMFAGMDSNIAGGALNIGAFAAAVALIHDLIKGLGLGELKEVLTEGLEGLLNGFTGALDAFQKSIIADAVVKIAVALAILAGSLYLISKIPADQLISAGIAMGGMAVGLGVFFKMLQGFAEAEKEADLTKMNAIAAALILLGGAMLLFSIAGSKFAEMDMEGVVKALLGLTGALAATNLAKKGQIDAIALFALALAFRTIASAAAMLAEVGWEDMGKLGAVMAAFLGSMYLLDKMDLGKAEKNIVQVAAAMLIISVAMYALAGAIKVMSLIDWVTFVDGLGKMAATMLVIGYAFKAFPEKDLIQAAAAITLVAFAMTMLAGPLMLFATMDVGDIAASLIVMGTALTMISTTLKRMNGVAVGATAILAVAVALNMLVPMIILLGSMPWQILVTGILALGAGLAIIAGVALLLKAAAIPLLLFGTALALIGGSVMLAGAGLMFIATAITALVAVGVGGVYVFIQALGVFIQALPQFAADIVTFLINLAAEFLNQSQVLIDSVVALGLSLLESLQVLIPPLIETIFILVEGLLDGLFTLLDENMGTWAEQGANAVAGFLEGVAEHMPRIVDAGTDIIVAFLEGVAEDIDDIVVAGGDIIVGFLEGLAENLDDVIAAAGGLVVAIIDGISLSLTDIVDAGGNLVIEFLSGLGTKSIEIAAAISLLIDDLIEALSTPTEIDKLVDKGGELLAKLIEGFGEIAGDVVTAIGDALLAILEKIDIWIEENKDEVMARGKSIADNVVSGFGQAMATFNPLSMGVSFGSGFLTGLKDVFRIHSPSRAMKEIGEFVTKGFVKGIVGTKDEVREAFATYGEAVKDVRADIKETIGDLKSDIADYKADLKEMENAKLDNRIAVIRAEDSLEAARQERQANLNRIKYLEERKSLNKEEQKELSELRDGRELDRLEVEKAKRGLKEAQKAQKDNIANIKKTKAAIEKANKALKQARSDYALSGKALEQYNRITKKHRVQLEKLAVKQDVVTKKLEAANEALEAAISKRDDYQNGISDSYDDFASVDADTKLSEWLDETQTQLDKTIAMRVGLEKLAELGLNDKLYKQLADQGIEALPFISQLIDSGQTGIDRVNELNSKLDDAADGIGSDTASQLYQAGVDAAQGLVDGLQAQSDKIAEEMEKIAETLVSAIKKVLKIKSPSRVMMEIGAYAGEGVAIGMASMERAVVQSAEDLASSGATALEDAMAAMQSVVADDIDLVPTITPVLDLSQVSSEASKIPGMFGDTSIDPTTSTMSANSAYDSYQEAREASTDAANGGVRDVTFNQYNNSPESLSSTEIYRQTNNQISRAKGALTI